MKNITKILLFLIICILVIGFSFISKKEFKKREKTLMPEAPENFTNITKIKSVIWVECSNGIVHYEEKITWNREPEETLKELLIEDFKESIISYGVEAKNCSVKLENNSSALSCDIYGSFHQSWYDFGWFLRPRSLDFLDTPFERKEQALVWSGNLDEVSTIININFPWPISNCHEHVWKK